MELAHSRIARQPYVASSALVATFFLVAVVLGGFVVIFVGIFAGSLFGGLSLRGIFAMLLVVARSGAEVAVAWFPYWGGSLADPPPTQGV